MFRYFILASIIFCSLELYSQISPNKNTISVNLDAQQNAYFIHEIIKSKGLKPILTCTNLNAKDILLYNKLDVNKPNFKEDIKVPIDLTTLLKSKPKNEKNFRQILYTIKKGETLFKLAKACNEDVASFKKRNNLVSNNVAVGKEVSFGWLESKLASVDEKKNEVKFIEPNTRLASNKSNATKVELVNSKKVEKLNTKKEIGKSISKPVIVARDTAMKKADIDLADLESKSKMWATQRGVAFWQPSHRKNKHKFVLHNSAQINSTIMLYNPMLKKSITAKVIGRIPEEAYKNNIDIVLSEGAANSLGALDSRFMVDIKYLK